MAETVAGILGPAVGDGLKWMGAQIKRQFTYLCCFSSNITSLRNEARELEATTGDLERRANHARDNVFVISGEVENWLKESKDIKGETDGILNEVPTVESGCLKLGARFSLSRRAMKTTARSKEHRERNKFKDDDIALPGSPAARRPVLLPATYEFESRKRIEEDIMTTLRGGDVTIMGICGMGGLGKTTMAKRIMNQALENKVFDEVVMVVVSQPVDLLKIQLEIGGSLGLKKLKEEESSQSRVKKLHERLSGTKRILLVLDDVWEKLVLEEVGIPRNHKRCTILITSRNRNVFTEMDVKHQDVFGMKELSEEEAWILFRGKVGTCVDDNKLNCIAKDVVKKCKGLPLALTVVGDALKKEMDEHVWKNSLRELGQVEPDIPKYIEDVYNPLKLSYDFLRRKHKMVFLLCCLYPEDADIPIEQLTYFSMGLGIFEGGIVEEARNWMKSLTKMLKNRSLLLDSDNEDDYVKMHDVVRDFCIFIAKEERHICGNDCTWISASQRSELPTTFAFPNLRLLFLKNKWYDEDFILDNNLLEGINDLNVLSIERVSYMSLSHTTKSLKSLKTLVLDQCRGLETLSVVGELVNLEIFICLVCDLIKELPPEMKELKRLKVLHLSWCGALQRIGGGIISSLVALEELKMLGSFNKWEEGENARLRELEELKMLRWLEIEIRNPAALAAAENMHLTSKLDIFHIKLSALAAAENMHFTLKLNLFHKKISDEFNDFRCNKKLELKCKEDIYLGHWIEKQLLPHTEALYLGGENVKCLAKCQNLRYFELNTCETIEECFITPMDGLEHLKLSKLPKLEKIWNDDRVSSNSFQNLKKLQLHGLPSLKHFGNDCPPQLEELRIGNCEIMEQVFFGKRESQNSHHITKVFPKLKNIELFYLANLTTFYQGIDGIKFPQLMDLDIRICPKMRSLVSKGTGSNEKNVQNLFFQEGLCGSLITSSIAGNHVSLTKPTTKQDMKGDERSLLFPKLERVYLEDLRELESFCEWKCEDELPSLRKVRIHYCPKMKQVWKSSSIREHNQTKDCLPQLTVIRIWNCEMMEQVFLWKEEHKNTSQSPNSHPVTKMFPKLEEICLEDLPNLTSFYQGIEGIEFPQLRELLIKNCPKMRSLVSKGVTSNENNWGGGSSSSLSCQPQEGSITCLEESFITSSIARTLCNLTKLIIEDCGETAHVITDDEKKGISGGERTLLQFPKLEELQLGFMPKLIGFCKWKCDIELPSLRKVEIYWCPNMKNLTFGSLYAPTLELFATDMHNHLQVPFNTSKKLMLMRCRSPLNFDKIDVSHFNGMEELTISRYEGSMSFFPSSIAGSLVNLTKLSIEFCNEMVKVIEDDEDKENVGNSGERRRLFPQLQKLELVYLYKLVSFCEWECDVELPSLMEVRIEGCDNMKRFTLGYLATPKLESVCIDYRYMVDVKDLNGLLQQKEEEMEEKKRNQQIEWMEEEEEDDDDEKEEEEEDDSDGDGDDVEEGDEGQERKGEIEEEQNS